MAPENFDLSKGIPLNADRGLRARQMKVDLQRPIPEVHSHNVDSLSAVLEVAALRSGVRKTPHMPLSALSMRAVPIRSLEGAERGQISSDNPHAISLHLRNPDRRPNARSAKRCALGTNLHE